MTERAQALEAARLDAALTVLETLQKQGYYLHRADGTLLDDRHEFIGAVVGALEAVSPPPPVGSPTTEASEQRLFPIMGSKRLTSLPWSLIAAHETQAKTNHGQSLETLAHRGGLDPTEALAVLTDRRWQAVFPHMTTEAAEDAVLALSTPVEPAGASEPPCPHCKLPRVLPEECTPELNAVIEGQIAERWDVLNHGIDLGQQFAAEKAGASEPPSEDEDPLVETSENCPFCDGCGCRVCHQSGKVGVLRSSPVSPVAPEPPTNEYDRMLAWRDLDRECDDICKACGGSGVLVYGNTSTWRGGIGGSAMTRGVCDKCWGSGNLSRPWTNLRNLPAPTGAPAPCVWRDIRAEVEKATAKFPTWPTDPLHALAILGEEFGELTKATVQQTYEPHKNAPGDLRKEAIQTAAMALRFVLSLDVYEVQPSAQHSQGHPLKVER